jgi:hypothetical protein
LRGVASWLLVTASVVPSSPILVTMMEAIRSSETSVLTTVTRRNIPEDAIFPSHRRENLKSYIFNKKLEIESVYSFRCCSFKRDDVLYAKSRHIASEFCVWGEWCIQPAGMGGDCLSTQHIR